MKMNKSNKKLILYCAKPKETNLTKAKKNGFMFVHIKHLNRIYFDCKTHLFFENMFYVSRMSLLPLGTKVRTDNFTNQCTKINSTLRDSRGGSGLKSLLN